MLTPIVRESAIPHKAPPSEAARPEEYTARDTVAIREVISDALLAADIDFFAETNLAKESELRAGRRAAPCRRRPSPLQS